MRVRGVLLLLCITNVRVWFFPTTTTVAIKFYPRNNKFLVTQKIVSQRTRRAKPTCVMMGGTLHLDAKRVQRTRAYDILYYTYVYTLCRVLRALVVRDVLRCTSLHLLQCIRHAWWWTASFSFLFHFCADVAHSTSTHARTSNDHKCCTRAWVTDIYPPFSAQKKLLQRWGPCRENNTITVRTRPAA